MFEFTHKSNKKKTRFSWASTEGYFLEHRGATPEDCDFSGDDTKMGRSTTADRASSTNVSAEFGAVQRLQGRRSPTRTKPRNVFSLLRWGSLTSLVKRQIPESYMRTTFVARRETARARIQCVNGGSQWRSCATAKTKRRPTNQHDPRKTYAAQSRRNELDFCV